MKKELEKALRQVKGEMAVEGGAAGDMTDRSLEETECTFSTFTDPPDNFMRPKSAVSANPTW